MVADQNERCFRLSAGVRDEGKIACADHRGFIDEQHGTRGEFQRIGFAGGKSAGGAPELLDVMRGQAETRRIEAHQRHLERVARDAGFFLKVLGGHAGYRGPLDFPARAPVCLGDHAHHGRLRRAGWAVNDFHPAWVLRGVADARLLLVIQGEGTLVPRYCVPDFSRRGRCLAGVDAALLVADFLYDVIRNRLETGRLQMGHVGENFLFDA